jgi:hypothetical protein
VTPPQADPTSLPNPVRDLSDRARDVADTLKRVHSRLIWAQLSTFVAAVGIALTTLFAAGERDALLFLGMFLVIATYNFAYLKAWLGARNILTAISLFFTESLMSFFAFILADRAPARRLLRDGVVVVREEVGALWIAAALLGLSGVLLLVHWVYAGRLRRGLTATAPAAPSSPSLPA